VALLGTSLALLNFGIDEFINPRLRVAGLSRRQAKRERALALPRRFVLGLTPVIRPPGAANGRAGTGGQPPGEAAGTGSVPAGRHWGIRGRGRR
jgi:peptide/nickel transport system permease protein